MWMPVVVPAFQEAPPELQTRIHERMASLHRHPYPPEVIQVGRYLLGLRLLDNVYIQYEILKRHLVVTHLVIIPGEIYQP